MGWANAWKPLSVSVVSGTSEVFNNYLCHLYCQTSCQALSARSWLLSIPKFHCTQGSFRLLWQHGEWPQTPGIGVSGVKTTREITLIFEKNLCRRFPVFYTIWKNLNFGKIRAEESTKGQGVTSCAKNSKGEGEKFWEVGMAGNPGEMVT